jgi:aminoglycoside 2''-phosphotransferase
VAHVTRSGKERRTNTDVLAQYRRRIQDVVPDLTIESLCLDPQGQNNHVVIVNDVFIFRFPRYRGGIERLERETAALRVLGPRLPLPIPMPRWCSFEVPEPGMAFMAYTALPGEPLNHLLATGTHGLDLSTVAGALGAFLTALHATPVDDVPTIGPDAAETPGAHWQDLYDRMRSRLFQLMIPDARRWTERHFEPFLQRLRGQPPTICVIHGDFGASNMLFDAKSRRLTGIIDFGSLHHDDPAVDLAAASTLAPGILRHFRPTYPNLDAVLDRVAFYRGTFALQEALFGVENGDEQALRYGLSNVPPPPGSIEL